jgi:hypothetical protein
MTQRLWAPLDMPSTGAEALDYLRCMRTLGDFAGNHATVVTRKGWPDAQWTHVYDSDGRLHLAAYVQAGGFWSFRFPHGPATGASRMNAQTARAAVLVGGES